uniref:Uncharacterized protein n=1 Tax=Arundo donax TaxID=35708 RepID=A0A0A9B4B9_ARUDO
MVLNAIPSPVVIREWLSSSHLQHPQAASYPPSITVVRLHRFIDAHTTSCD